MESKLCGESCRIPGALDSITSHIHSCPFQAGCSFITANTHMQNMQNSPSYYVKLFLYRRR
jgi:hypothetical protein